MRTCLPILLLGLVADTFGAPLSLRDGDIVFQTSRSTQSVAVQKATQSRYSHMGIVFLRNGQPFVLEAAGRVHYTPLAQWVARGVGGHVVAKRLRNAEAMNPAAAERLRRAAESFNGRPYDLTFEWSDERIYCSELVWKAFQRGLGIELGALQALKDFHLEGPEVRQKMKERYGDRVPLQEPVIAPAAVFDSDRLMTVLER